MDRRQHLTRLERWDAEAAHHFWATMEAEGVPTHSCQAGAPLSGITDLEAGTCACVAQATAATPAPAVWPSLIGEQEV